VQNWLGIDSFLSSPVLGTCWLKKSEKNAFRRVPILACFFGQKSGGKKVGVKQRIVCVKRILLSFPQFLHEVHQCTQNVFHQLDQHPQMLRKNTVFVPK
jgi:hypothetical protein